MPTVASADATVPPFELDTFAEQLALRLSWLHYKAFALVISQLLVEMGYEDIQRTNRQHLKGRTNHGGYDVRGALKTSSGPVPVLLQLKLYKKPVPAQFVDQLRGTALRLHVPQALIISTSGFAPPAIKAALAFPGRPVRLINRLELGRLMIHYRVCVNVRIDLTSGERLLTIDEVALKRLEDQVRASQPQRAAQKKGGKR